MKKNYYILSILFFLTLAFKSQTVNEKIDFANKIYFSDPDSSFAICSEVELALNKANKNALAEVYLCQARYYLLKTNFDKSTALLNDASAIFEKEKNLSKLAKCYSLKSILLNRVSDKKNALLYQQKALDLYTTANDKDGQISSLTNISLDFLDDEVNDSALIYLIKLKKFSDEMVDDQKYFMHQNFGTYYYNVGNYKSSIEELNRAYNIAERLDMIDSKATILMLTAKTNIAQKNYVLAENNLSKSLAIATGNNLLHESNEAYQSLIELYEILGDYKQAFKMKKLNDIIEEKIYDLEKINKINEIEGQLKLAEKEKIIVQSKLKLKSEQLNTVKAKSRVTQLFLVMILSILIIISVIIILLRTKKLNKKISLQKIMLEQKSIEITDSINYAKRIQAAILPDLSYFKEYLPNSFILYLPKDIVAGDFYWMHKFNDTILFAVADCTGHGVPGAMVSVVCSNALNQSVKELNSTNPAQILKLTRTMIKENLSTSKEENIKDGMDIALCSLDLKTLKIEFAGAHNPLIIVRHNELIEIKGDKQPVGKHFNEKDFEYHHYQLQKNDVLYIFSDGYADQFGGPKGKKFMYKQLKELLVNMSPQPIDEQQKILMQTFKHWKGELEQIDDICVIGVKL